MSLPVHEQQGLRISRNEKNGFTVCRLHYTADPRKRSEEWKKAAMRGMSLAQFEQEFEINYASHLGERVFPEIRDKRHEIVIPEGPYQYGEWPAHLPMWAGFDYGAKNPSSLHVYTIVDGITYALWELYEPCRNILDFAAAIKACPYYKQIRYIVADPDISNRKQIDMKTGNMTSVQSRFEELGITKFLKGNNDEQAWLVQMRKHWCSPEVTFKILTACPRMIDEFENATFVSMSDKQLETMNEKEAIVDRNNHAMDDCKYFMNSQAREVTRQVNIKNPALGYYWTTGPSRVYGRERELGLVI